MGHDFVITVTYLALPPLHTPEERKGSVLQTTSRALIEVGGRAQMCTCTYLLSSDDVISLLMMLLLFLWLDMPALTLQIQIALCTQ